MRVLACALIAVVLQAQPSFRSGVELIRIDVSVADKDGRRVSDLRPEDFVVTIDGRPRPVAFARFHGSDETAAATAAPPIEALPATATNRNVASGRIVVFVVDLESMNAGYDKVLLETAAMLVDRLAPGDAVGLQLIPGKGVEITRDHARVRDGIAALRGAAPKAMQFHVISMREAIAYEKRDRRIMNEVVERECRDFETSCPVDLRNEAAQLLIEARRRIQNVVATLGTLNARLAPIQAPKDIVLLSAGLPFDQETISSFRDLERRVAESGAATHIVQLAQPETDASSRRGAGSEALPAADLREGLSMVAGVTGADVFEGVGRATGAFERIGNAMAHAWQIGIEATPQDADGKVHKIAVSSRRPGLTVRARREFILSSAARPATNPVDLLAQPVDAVELPIAAATYSVRGDEAATLKQILLIQAIGAGTQAPPAYAIAVMKDGRPVFQTDGALTVTGDEAQTLTAAQLPRGLYRVRIAVVDAAGRGGSLEMPLSVGLRAGRPLQFSDVFVGRLGDRFMPATEMAVGAPLGAFVELYAADPAAFARATVVFELRRSGLEPVLARSAADLSTTDAPGRVVADTTLATTNIDPGEHTVSAVISLDGAIVGRVSRSIQLTR